MRKPRRLCSFGCWLGGGRRRVAYWFPRSACGGRRRRSRWVEPRGQQSREGGGEACLGQLPRQAGGASSPHLAVARGCCCCCCLGAAGLLGPSPSLPFCQLESPARGSLPCLTRRSRHSAHAHKCLSAPPPPIPASRLMGAEARLKKTNPKPHITKHFQ